MKKSILIIAALAMCVFAKAWEVGDFYANDPTGVPAVVVYVDESGEHGLIMSPIALTDKQYKELIKKKTFEKNKKWYDKQIAKRRKKIAKTISEEELTEYDKINQSINQRYYQVLEWLENAPRLYDGKLKEKEERKAIEEAASQNGEYGEENQKNIIAYCQEYNIDLTQYFRQNDWAQQLGEGWFIPGNAELELFNKTFADGVGKKYKFPMTSMEPYKRTSAFMGKIGPFVMSYTGGSIFPWNLLFSSTMVKSGWSEIEENKDKTGKYVVKTGGALVAAVNAIVQAADKDNYYSLCAFQNMEGSWWMFAYNAQQESSIVAFKRF